MDNSGVLAVAERACLLECLAQWRAGAAGGLGVVTSSGMDGASVTISTNFKQVQRRPDSADNFVSPLVGALLSGYRKIPVAR